MESHLQMLDHPHGKIQLAEYLFMFTTILLFLRLLQIISETRKRRKFEESAKTENYKAYYSLTGPKPSLIPLVGNALLFLTKTDLVKILRDQWKEYGPAYRLSFFNRDYLIINSAPMVQALLTSNDMGHFRKGALEEYIFPEGVEGLGIYTGEKWKVRRKMLNRTFTYKALQRYNTCFNKQADRMVDELEKLFRDGKAHAIDNIVKQCIFRQSSETLMGVDLTESSDGEMYCRSMETFMDTTYERIYSPWLFPKWIWYMSSAYRKNQKALYCMAGIASKVITKRMDEIKRKNLSQTKDSESGGNDTSNMIEVMLHHGVSEELIFHEVALMLGIAHDTTSISVFFALFLLAHNPEQQRLCREEIDALFNDPLKYKDGILNFDALPDLKYLERCLHESQRMLPLAVVMRQLDTPLDLGDNLVVPPGVSIFIPANVMHMLPEYFPNPEKFDPDRFLPEQIRQRHPYAYVPFSGGPRTCIGMKMALVELKIVLAKILHHFEVFTPMKMDELKVVITGIPRPAKPINFILKKRAMIN